MHPWHRHNAFALGRKHAKQVHAAGLTVDTGGRAALMMVKGAGYQSFVFMPPAIAFHLCRCTEDTAQRFGWRPEDALLATELDIPPEEFDLARHPRPGMAKRLLLEGSERDLLAIFQFERDIYQPLRFRPRVALLIAQRIRGAEGPRFQDLEADSDLPPPSRPN